MLTPAFSGANLLTDLVVGASLFFPPIFKAVILGFFFWLLIHPLVRGWIYSGDVWHPTLFDLSLFVLCVTAALWLIGHG
ncbi:DUF1656 domain-containing protein [Pantoea agglomerans]|uniref:DUF1656 domain-containing protein n=1 Tax=Enterobacter agglomerans TaxID=549 RepID=UPI0015FD92B6|nr:DUF1656 domain-containing protein [Pantoea agglomerans]MBA8867851.1 hypothetical protein [Pantoea agglomerans]MBA8872851.1 hypothetical protein [Pantoea agglomerans]